MTDNSLGDDDSGKCNGKNKNKQIQKIPKYELLAYNVEKKVKLRKKIKCSNLDDYNFKSSVA